MVFRVTERAVREILRIAEENSVENPVLRVRVVPGGCSNFRYSISFAERVEERDHVFEFGELKVVIDPVSMPYIDGAELDYVVDFMGGGFAIRNPNISGPCE